MHGSWRRNVRAHTARAHAACGVPAAAAGRLRRLHARRPRCRDALRGCPWAGERRTESGCAIFSRTLSVSRAQRTAVVRVSDAPPLSTCSGATSSRAPTAGAAAATSISCSCMHVVVVGRTSYVLIYRRRRRHSVRKCRSLVQTTTHTRTMSTSARHLNRAAQGEMLPCAEVYRQNPACSHPTSPSPRLPLHAPARLSHARAPARRHGRARSCRRRQRRVRRKLWLHVAQLARRRANN